MGNGEDALRELLERQKADADSVDLDEVRDDWVTATGELVESMRAWLRPLEEEEKGLLSVDVHSFAVGDENLGIDKMEGLRITSPGRRVVDIRPTARFVLGFQGRVEMDAGAKAASLLRDREGDWVWYERRGTLVQTVKLDEEVFLNLLTDLLR